MKKEILNWFRTSRDFKTAVVLYRKYGNNRAYARMFNMSGATKDNMNIIFEEFRKMAGLSFTEFKKIMDKPVKNLPKNSKVNSDKVKSDKSEKERGIVITKVTKTISAKDIPQKKLRDEFPFLSDPKCPVELKAMVSDKITAYHNYKKGHEELFEATTTDEELQAVKKVVENYISNQEMYKELNHFNKFSKILGEHDFFDKKNRLKELAAMSTQELTIRKENVRRYILRDNKKVADPKKEHLRAKTQKALDMWAWELTTVESLLLERK